VTEKYRADKESFTWTEPEVEGDIASLDINKDGTSHFKIEVAEGYDEKAFNDFIEDDQ